MLSTKSHFFEKRGSNSHLPADCLPTEGQAFNSANFCSALDKHFATQPTEKKELIHELKTASTDLSDLAKKLAFQDLLSEGEKALRSGGCWPRQTPESTILERWLKCLNQDRELQQAAVSDKPVMPSYGTIPHI